MKVTITSLQLKNPLKFFSLSYKAMKIMWQLKSAECIKFKKRGIWTKHYTMSLWKNEDDMRNFATSGAHLDAMKRSGEIAKEIRIVTVNMEKLPDWKTAFKLLETARVLKYK